MADFIFKRHEIKLNHLNRNKYYLFKQLYINLLMERIMPELLTKDTFMEKVFNYEQNKEWKFEGDLPCMIDFYADWCGPCKMVAPIMEKLANEYDGKVNFYKINTEIEQELAMAFGIQSIPSLLFIPKEGQPQMAIGALPENTIKQIIDEQLLSSDTNGKLSEGKKA
jgi:thioredoxin 1